MSSSEIPTPLPSVAESAGRGCHGRRGPLAFVEILPFPIFPTRERGGRAERQSEKRSLFGDVIANRQEAKIAVEPEAGCFLLAKKDDLLHV